jgi:catechol 2,3-dioxygenase-like lactoylglutathione lyase family enzyme
MKLPSCLLAGVIALSLLAPATARADLAPFNGVGVTFAHLHLFVKDIEAHKKFWTEVMGGTFVTSGPLQMIEFPGTYIILTQREYSGPPEGSVLNHFGFVYKDLPATIARWKAIGADARQGRNPNQGYVWGPDGINIEYYGDPAIPVPVKMDHTHAYVPNIKACKAWYQKVLGGVPGERPRVSLPAWNPVSTSRHDGDVRRRGTGALAHTRTVARSHGLRSEGPRPMPGSSGSASARFVPRQIPGTQIKVAFLTDPWGTRIELTQNLAPAFKK